MDLYVGKMQIAALFLDKCVQIKNAVVLTHQHAVDWRVPICSKIKHIAVHVMQRVEMDKCVLKENVFAKQVTHVVEINVFYLTLIDSIVVHVMQPVPRISHSVRSENVERYAQAKRPLSARTKKVSSGA